MSTTIKVIGDTIKVEKTFLSGKDRVAVNGTIVFKGNATLPNTAEIKAGGREYKVGIERIGWYVKTFVVHLEILDNGRLLHSGNYDPIGKSVENAEQARSSAGVQTCAFIGGTVGVAVMIGLNSVGHAAPGGAIGGAVGGGIGAAIGFGIGELLYGKRP